MTPGARDAASAVIAAQQRFRDRQRSRRRRSLRTLAILVAAVVVIAGLGWALLWSPLFEVHTVTVEGISRLSAAQVVHAADIRSGSSLVRLDPTDVARRVEQLRPVATATVSRRWPHGVVVRVRERRPAAAVAQPQGTELVDATGVAFATTDRPPAGLVQLDVGGPLPGSGAPDARAAMHVLAALPPSLRSRVHHLSAPSPADVRFRLSDGRTVVWGSAADSRRKAVVLAALLHRKARVYDVSTPVVAVTR